MTCDQVDAEIIRDAHEEEIEDFFSEADIGGIVFKDLKPAEEKALFCVIMMSQPEKNPDKIWKMFTKQYPAMAARLSKKIVSAEEADYLRRLEWLAKKPWWRNQLGVKTFLTPEGASYAKEEDSEHDRKEAREIARDHPELVAKIKEKHPKLAARIMKEIQ